jgi:hypothetical protein
VQWHGCNDTGPLNPQEARHQVVFNATRHSAVIALRLVLQLERGSRSGIFQGGVLTFDLLLGRQGGRVAMHLWHLLEACVVFAMALTFVIAFRLNK